MNIVITGASRGIGAELALKIAEENDHSLILISRNRDCLNGIQQKMEQLNNRIHCEVIPSDLSEINNIKVVAGLIKEKFKVVDVLINNAGLLVNKTFENTSPEEISDILGVNLVTPAILIRELLEPLRNSDKAHVINIGSIGGVQGSVKFPGLSFYSAAKGALAILTECLAEEYKKTNIKFNCLALGSVDTEMFRKAFPGYKASLNASEMAAFIKNFAFTGHRYFNGKILPVAITTP